MGTAYKVEQDGATIPYHQGIVNHRGLEVESTESRVHRRGDVITDELGRAFLAALESGDEHANSLVTEIEVADPGDEVPQQVSSGDAGDGPYDPADYDVDEVQNYLDGADDDERSRVLSLEGSGKARKGILEYEPDDDGG